MQLRIAHVSATFPPYRGGTGNVCYHNARELARRGHDVHVFTAAVPGSPSRETHEGLTIHRLRPLLRVGNAPVLPGLVRALRGFDVIHLHYPFFGGELTAFVARLNRTPLVVTYHQDVHLAGAFGAIAFVLRHTLGAMALRSAQRLLFTSLDYGRASYSRPLLRGREHVIAELPNGVDVAQFTAGNDAAKLRAYYNLNADDRVVLLVAGLDRAHHFKGVPVLLEALAQLPLHIKAIIVGSGELRQAYEQRAQTIGTSQRIIFAGRVPEHELPNHYRLADVTVLPSTTMGEAFGLVLLESLASATPVIASDLPGVRTVVANRRDGLLVPPGEPTALAKAIEDMLGDETERQAMGQRGRARVIKTYGWEQIGARLEHIYAQVMERQSQAVVALEEKR